MWAKKTRRWKSCHVKHWEDGCPPHTQKLTASSAQAGMSWNGETTLPDASSANERIGMQWQNQAWLAWGGWLLHKTARDTRTGRTACLPLYFHNACRCRRWRAGRGRARGTRSLPEAPTHTHTQCSSAAAPRTSVPPTSTKHGVKTNFPTSTSAPPPLHHQSELKKSGDDNDKATVAETY
jgi:hypothetical protein